MASEIAKSVWDKWTVTGDLKEIIDTELQEAREVLAEVIREHDDPKSDYGCTTNTTERARALSAKLETTRGN